jgi:hypothetical protein
MVARDEAPFACPSRQSIAVHNANASQVNPGSFKRVKSLSSFENVLA